MFLFDACMKEQHACGGKNHNRTLSSALAIVDTHEARFECVRFIRSGALRALDSLTHFFSKGGFSSWNPELGKQFLLLASAKCHAYVRRMFLSVSPTFSPFIQLIFSVFSDDD